MSNAFLTIPDADASQFLKIASQGAGLSTHADLWRWLQGDVQQWLSHQVMLIAWGDFRSGDLHYDLVSSMPGMRTHQWTVAAITPLAGYLRDCWVAAQQLPCQLEIGGCDELVRHAGSTPMAAQAVGEMRTALVHGVAGHDGTDRIFAALGREETRPAGAGSALKLLLPFIDTALRRMPPPPVRKAPCERDLVARQVLRLSGLSDRETQIMKWVAMGKTNPEIGCILCISEFTVKNHMKSIFTKLDVTNRAQAVAQLTRISVHA